jgi:hypothetical protein
MRIFRAEEIIDAANRKLDLMFRTYTMLADEVDSEKSIRLEWMVDHLDPHRGHLHGRHRSAALILRSGLTARQSGS